ncbi:MAG: hypothetical protein ABJL55_18785 [Roseibium sp.]
MRRLRFIFLILLFSTGVAVADGLPSLGDFYLISRDKFGFFTGSHKLFEKHSSGLIEVSYCNRIYYVRRNTVAWVHVENDRGNLVQIEFNFGRGWRPICRNPQSQVTLSDLGISMTPEEVLATPEPVQSRFSAIALCSENKCN